MIEIKERAAEIKAELAKIRRDFHRNPELGECEFRTMDKICEYLNKWGIEYISGVANTGVVAIIRGKGKGKTVGVRADMDALPIAEENEVSYKSAVNGVMHACGHDAHVTIALGAAKILKEIEDNINGNVKFIFQPAEETVGGADRMIKEGCLKNPDVDYIIGLHVDPNLNTGQIGVKYGKMMASSDELTIRIKGKSTHGAHPDEGIDPIFIASNLVVSLQSLVSRNLSPVNSAILTIGTIHGGTKGNIIPDEVIMTGILRTLDDNTRAYMKKRIKETVEGIAASFGGEGTLGIRESYGSLINDDNIVNLVRNTAENILGSDNVIVKEHPSMGTEDFSYFSKMVKACFYNLGCRNEEKNKIYPIHSSKFDIDEDCLPIGVMLQAASVIELLKE